MYQSKREVEDTGHTYVPMCIFHIHESVWCSPAIEGRDRSVNVVCVNILCITVWLAVFMLMEQIQLNQNRLSRVSKVHILYKLSFSAAKLSAEECCLSCSEFWVQGQPTPFKRCWWRGERGAVPVMSVSTGRTTGDIQCAKQSKAKPRVMKLELGAAKGTSKLRWKETVDSFIAYVFYSLLD